MQLIRDQHPDAKKQGLYRQAIFIVIIGNALLAVAKGAVAYASGSSAVFSEAANSLSDTFYGLLMSVGLYLSQRPADISHPQGHSRFEPFISLFIAMAMGIAGVTAIWNSINRLIADENVIAPSWPTVVLAIGVLVKIAMYVSMANIGNRSRSPAITASAKDNLADILATSTALVGIWGSLYIHPYFDPVAGILVALWIFRTMGSIVCENLGYLTGRGASEELIARITGCAVSVPEVQTVHQVITEYVGPQLRVDMHINLGSDIPLEHVHAIEEAVRAAVENLPEVDIAYIHAEPTGMN